MTERNAGAGQGDDREPVLPPEEEAAWAAIIAAYGEEPDAVPEREDTTERSEADGERDEPGDPDGDLLTKPGHGRARDGAEDDHDRDDPGETRDAERDRPDRSTGDDPPAVRSLTVYAAGTGPRDWRAAPEEGEDEDHFVPPEPPPLPNADMVTKFAWLGALGGPLLLIGSIILRVDMTWWVMTLGVGGFLGGFATLLTRLRDDSEDDDFDDPGRGAVV
ncbi:hypothetical protein [Streptomyces oceani]|uniref:Uncharacterized protein n=1 Tax=Streptomyces oceani TaxID=1075402 RepID=A0A1E7KCM4_9ACTN|nr:hypothetical protein [Streptomyces oceani]OEV01672.1 hypothetical protein AN216_16670 [Streptomyces oceani]